MEKQKRLGVYTHEINGVHERVHQHQARLQSTAEKSTNPSTSFIMDPSMYSDTQLATNLVIQSQQHQNPERKEKYRVCHVDIAAVKERYVHTPVAPTSNVDAAIFNQRMQSLMQQHQSVGNSLQRDGTAAIAHIRQPQQQQQPAQTQHSNYSILPHNPNNCNNNNGKLNQNFVQESFGGSLHAKMKPRNKNEEAVNDLLLRIPDVDRTFDVHSRIGNGTFSTVLLATLKRERLLPESARRKFAIKHHIPTSHPDRIMKELQCMKKMGGMNNVVGINCCIRCEASVAFIMPYMQHDRFHEFFTKMKPAEVRFYMRNLLIALRHVHKFGIIHRDVKPSNFLYNRRLQQFLLVDFGLAQHVPPTAASDHTANRTQAKQLMPSLDATATKMITTASVEPSAVSGQKRMRENDDLQQMQDGPSTAKRSRTRGEFGNATTLGSTLNAQNATKMPLKQINSEITSACAKTSEMPAPETKVHEANKSTLVEQQPQQEATDATVGPTETTSSGAAAALANATNINKYNTNRNSNGTHNLNKCYCYGNSTVCNVCLVKKEVHASRAGTPGYRPPEVLLKYPDQTTSVDVWAAGVIFLSILSSVYPFFKAPSDYIALAEIITIFGDKTIRKTAFALDRLLTLSQRAQPLDIHKLCVRFRNRAIFSSSEMLKRHQQPDGSCDVCKNCDQYFFNCLCLESQYTTEPCEEYDIFPPSAYDLLHRLLEVNPHKRITADEALKHPFLCESDDAAIKTDAAVPVANANTQVCVGDKC